MTVICKYDIAQVSMIHAVHLNILKKEALYLTSVYSLIRPPFSRLDSPYWIPLGSSSSLSIRLNTQDKILVATGA